MQNYLENLYKKQKDIHLLQDILPPIHLLLGEEKYFINKFINQFQNIVLNEEIDKFNCTKIIDDTDNALDALKTAIMTIPMFGQRRLVILYSKLLMKGTNKGMEEFLLNSIDNWPPKVYLLIVAEQNFDKRLKIYKAMEKKTKVLQTAPLTGPALHNWIREQIKRAGKVIEDDAVAFLENIYGNQIQTLDTEIKKFISFSKDKKIITLSDVEECSSADVYLTDKAIFEWGDLISSRKISESLKFYHDLVKKGSYEAYLFAMLTRQIRLTALVWELRNKGLNYKEVATRLQEHPFSIQKIYPLVNRFKYNELLLLWQELLKINTGVFEGKMDWTLGIENFFLMWSAISNK